MNSGEIKAWVDLQSHAEEIKGLHLSELFRLEADRFDEFSFSTESFLLDLSKQRITKDTLGKLTALAEQQALGEWIEKLFTGEQVNVSEGRSALHTALRLPKEETLKVNDRVITEDIHASLEKMALLVRQIQQAQWRGFDGRPIRSIVNIGVGGSNLGPLMACDALEQYTPAESKQLDIHF
ncbi:MAG: glucose-6-phosphate isomerase, partial [Cycloclasticus pugetii]